MRKWIDLLIEGPHVQSYACFHGSQTDGLEFHIDPNRGMYFTTDPEYAAQYGEWVYECRVTLSNPRVYSEEESHGMMEIDRLVLIDEGYDGRIIEYADGQKDIIAFHQHQIKLRKITRVG
jgi:hypothetical protein